jgi:hypothetical protein
LRSVGREIRELGLANHGDAVAVACVPDDPTNVLSMKWT